MNISPNPVWLDALTGSSWVSIGDTGDPSDKNFVVFPNGTLVSFYQQFFMDGPTTFAALSVLADDTTTVMLNGNLIASPFTVSGRNCALKPIGCLSVTRGDFASAALIPFVVTGMNTLRFDVEQDGLQSFGLDYTATFSNSPLAASPEPGTAWLMGGAGLVMGIAVMRKRRRAS